MILSFPSAKDVFWSGGATCWSRAQRVSRKLAVTAGTRLGLRLLRWLPAFISLSSSCSHQLHLHTAERRHLLQRNLGSALLWCWEFKQVVSSSCTDSWQGQDREKVLCWLHMLLETNAKISFVFSCGR